MTDHGIVQSTVKPEPIRIDDYSVWVSTEVEAFTEEDRQGFHYQLIQYSKDEALKLMINRNQMLETDLTDLQLALCELYEGMVI